MPTNPNMVAIQTVTVGAGGAASIDFTNIPQTYTDLVVQVSGRGTGAGGEVSATLQFNNNSSNYSSRWLRGNGAAASSGSDTYGTDEIYLFEMPAASATASTFQNGSIYIPNYTSSNNKSVSVDSVSENNATTAWAYLTAGLWSNSAAVTSIKLLLQVGNFAQYSTATLYGVTSAQGLATGGFVTQDANYYYHTFTSSGTFTPKQALSCDILAVAGGGGGGTYRGGGGGAGGVIYWASQSLTATGHTVTVGAGGGNSTNGSNSQFASLTVAVGGGAGSNSTGSNGGSGGGGGYDNGTAGTSTQTGTGATAFYGNNAGILTSGATSGGAGGGGAGAVGGNAGNLTGGAGGIGINTYSSWHTATSTGVGGYIAGGGGGGGNTSGGTGGSGGGGNGGTNAAVATDATANTGGGGGGGGDQGSAPGYNGRAGGSGLVIIRYAK